MSERLPLAFIVIVALAATPAAAQDVRTETVPVAPMAAAPVERVTFEVAVRRALERNPTVGQASQAILRAQALLDQARAVFRPSVSGAVATTVLDAARGFDDNITQPRRQTSFTATASYPILASSRWALAKQAADQVGIARISAEETRRQVALLAAESYLAVISSEHQRDIAVRNRDTAAALEAYARARLDAGQGSRLNHVRASQERASAEGLIQASELAVRQAQEALGIALFADGPVDALGEPQIEVAPVGPEPEAWLARRPDVRLLEAEVQAADRVVRDVWKSWLPTASVNFRPVYVTPPGFFEPAGTWGAFVQLQVPIYDGVRGSTRRLRTAELETARLRLEAIKNEARSEVRFAYESVERNEQIVTTSLEAAESAREALRITEIAYKAGATTNIEVVQAQQAARNSELVASIAEARLRQARLDLLVALGRFP